MASTIKGSVFQETNGVLHFRFGGANGQPCVARWTCPPERLPDFIEAIAAGVCPARGTFEGDELVDVERI